MKTVKIFLLLTTLNVSLFSTSIYSKELKEHLRQWQQEKMLRDAKEKMVACNEQSMQSIQTDEQANKSDAGLENDN